MGKKITKTDVNTSVEDKYRQLKEYGDKHDCDAVMLTDGTIKNYSGERYNAVAIYKVKHRKIYEF